MASFARANWLVQSWSAAPDCGKESRKLWMAGSAAVSADWSAVAFTMAPLRCSRACLMLSRSACTDPSFRNSVKLVMQKVNCPVKH